MVLVVSIIGVLSAIVLPRFLPSTAQAEINAHAAERAYLDAKLELYYFKYQTYPISDGTGSISDWTTDVDSFFPDGLPEECNKGISWEVLDGEIDMSGHETHE